MTTKKNTQINLKAYKDKHTVNVNIAMTIKVNMNKHIKMSIFFLVVCCLNWKRRHRNSHASSVCLRTLTESESLTIVHWRCLLWMEISSSNTEMTSAGFGAQSVATLGTQWQWHIWLLRCLRFRPQRKHSAQSRGSFTARRVKKMSALAGWFPIGYFGRDYDIYIYT